MVKTPDDFLFIGDSFNDCLYDLQSFKHMCQLLAVPLAEHKTVGPTTSLTFLGIEIDIDIKEARIPKEKISTYTLDIATFLTMEKCTLREMKSLIGKLQFTTSVVTTGRCFLRRLHDSTMGVKKPHYKLYY